MGESYWHRFWYSIPVWTVRKLCGRTMCIFGKHAWLIECGFGMVNYSGHRCWWCHKFVESHSSGGVGDGN